MTTRSCYRAAWVFPVDRPPIENGLIESVDGRITTVRAAWPGDDAINLGDVALIPGLVNAHVHLEFSLVKRPFEPARPFTEWIRSLMAYRRSTLDTNAETKQQALRTGWLEAAQTGTTLLGEIATGDWRPNFDDVSPHVVPFQELIGLRADRLDQQVELARAFLESSRSAMRGLSPHAPYSVGRSLLEQIVCLASKFDAPLAMHVAETREELELLESGTGELADMLKAFGAWPDEGFTPGQRPLDFLRMLAAAPRALIVHGNYLADDELDFIAVRPNLSLIYCPRTHDYFGHESHPWRRLLARGGTVAIGTDGRGSNPDLSLWRELTFLRDRFADVSPSTLLELGTLAGAKTLGLDHDYGSLTVGKRTDIAIVALNSSKRPGDPHEWLLASDSPTLLKSSGL